MKINSHHSPLSSLPPLGSPKNWLLAQLHNLWPCPTFFTRRPSWNYNIFNRSRGVTNKSLRVIVCYDVLNLINSGSKQPWLFLIRFLSEFYAWAIIEVFMFDVSEFRRFILRWFGFTGCKQWYKRKKYLFIFDVPSLACRRRHCMLLI